MDNKSYNWNPFNWDFEPIETDIEETDTDEHWQDVRERAAIAALGGLLADWNINGKVDTLAKVAVNYADALIEELKKK